MTTNRRNPRASSLRNLFEEQWSQLRSLLKEWEVRRDKEQEKNAQVSEAIESVVEGTDPRMRIISSYKNKLRGGVHKLLDHVEAMVSGLPGVVEVNQRTYASDPQVNALFVNKKEMRKHFSRSRDLQAFFSSTDADSYADACALLFLTRREKSVLGMDRKGDMLLRDVRQVTVSFTGHHVTSARATEDEVRDALENILFDSVVEYVRVYMVDLTAGVQDNKEEMKIPDYRHDLKNPAVYLRKLGKVLSEPTQLLKLNENMLRINKLGIKLEEDSIEDANELYFKEVKIGERPTRIVLIVRYPRSEILTVDEMIKEFKPYRH